MTPAIIEMAINGITTKDRTPHVPITPDEIAQDAVRLLDAGAAIIHNHNEDIHLVGDAAARAYAEGWARVLAEHPSAILCPTVVQAPTIAEKIAHLKPCADYGARMGAIDPGSRNAASTAPDGSPGARRHVSVISFDEIDAVVAALGDAGLGPSIGVYEPGYLRAALAYHRAGRLPQGALVKLYFAGPHDFHPSSTPSGSPALGFGLPPTRAALDAYLEMLEGSGLPWSVAVLGGDAVESGIVRLALERGGHVRVGLEDYAGDALPTNMELLKAVLAECRKAGRRPATPREAATILKLKDRAARF